MFKVYRAIPFLYEIRTIIDWTCTKTSIDLFQWFKLEDAYCTLYNTKADMDSRKADHKFGEHRPLSEKIMFGCCLSTLLILVLLFPIFLFSSMNPAV